MTFVIDGANSSATVGPIEGCTGSGCSLTVAVVPYLSQSLTLSLGQVGEFGFFTTTVGGNGAAHASVTATLVLSTMGQTFDLTGNGEASWATDGTFSMGTLAWSDMPQFVTLPNGSEFGYEFTGISTAGLGTTSGVDVLIQPEKISPVPLPSASGLMILGLGALGGLGFWVRRGRVASSRRREAHLAA